jgi:hypothetical protein
MSSLLPRLLDALLAGIQRSLATFGLFGHFFARFGIGCHLGLVRCINLIIFFLLLLRCLERNMSACGVPTKSLEAPAADGY